jgi:hypothetical protein
MTGLPLGLSFNSATGLVSGTLDDKYVDGDLIHVTVTVTDSYDGAARTTSFDYKVMLGYMYWRLNDSVTPAGNTWPGVYWGELKLFDKSGASLAVSGSAAVDKLISSPDVFNNPTDSNPGRVFDGDQRTGMIFGADGNGVRYIGVKFKQPQSIGSVYVSLAKPVLTSDFNWVAMYFPAVPVNFKIEASGDGVTWTTMYTASFTGVGGGLNRTQWDATYVLP